MSVRKALTGHIPYVSRGNHTQIPGISSVSKSTPRSKRPGYAERFSSRSKQSSPCGKSYSAHKGPSRFEGTTEEFRRFMTEGVRFGRK